MATQVPIWEGIGLNQEDVELCLSYFTITLNRRGIGCATFAPRNSLGKGAH